MTNASRLINTVFPSHLDEEMLITRSHAGNLENVYHCVPGQSILQMSNLVLEALKFWPIVIVLAIDAIPWFMWKKVKSECECLIPLTSVTPTTSATAWTSAICGILPEEHGIHGVALFDKYSSGTVSILSNTLYKMDGGTANLPLDHMFKKIQKQTIFNKAAALGVSSRLIGRYGLTNDSILAVSLANGSELLIPENYDELLEKPSELIDFCKSELLCILAKIQKPSLIHCFIDLDTALHETSYNDIDLESLLKDLFSFAHSLTKLPGTCVLTISDHGMVKQQLPLAPCPINNPAVWDISYARPGGAGRVLFFYPYPGYKQKMWMLLENLFGESAIIMDRETYIKKYLGASSVAGKSRIGDIIALAISPSFPAVMNSSIQEHGAMTLDEMFVGGGVVSVSD